MAILFIGMLVMIAVVCVFSNTSTLLLTPLTQPDQFLAGMPHVTLSLFGWHPVLIQPSSTILVYLLGLLMVALGIYFLAAQKEQKSRKYWGIGLILWGISAIAAGTSYQAFGYELKCRGRELCLFTDNFELVYMLLTAYSINFLVAATGYTSLGAVGRKRIIRFAIIDSIAYSLFMLVGAVLPVQFMVSYEGFMAFIGGNFVLMFILAIRYYKAKRDRLNLKLIWIWVGFLGVNLGYFAALFSGFPEALYANRGIWFNANDTLHVLLILWAGMVFLMLKKDLADRATNID
jgi:uncharacterized membrane protein